MAQPEHNARLEDWRVTYSMGNAYLSGFIFNDDKERFRDGTPVVTSQVNSMSHNSRGFEEGAVVATANTIYLLGKKANDF